MLYSKTNIKVKILTSKSSNTNLSYMKQKKSIKIARKLAEQVKITNLMDRLKAKFNFSINIRKMKFVTILIFLGKLL